MMMKQQIFGISKLVFLRSVFNAVTWRITSGLWEYLDHVAHVLKFITIEALHMAQKADRLQMKTDILKFGTLFSCRMNAAQVAEKIVIQFLGSYRQRVLIPALA